jgi:gluconokinase
MEYIIGIDIGTTSTKAIGFDLQGRVLSKSNIGYQIYNPKPDWSEKNPEEIFRAVINYLKKVISENNALGNKLLAVGFSAAMHSLIAVDREGKPMTNCIIWADRRNREFAERIKAIKQGHEIFMGTGTPIHRMSPLCKLI